MKSWEIMLVEEACRKAMCHGPIVPGYEACCVSLNSLQLVNILLDIEVSADGSILQELAVE